MLSFFFRFVPVLLQTKVNLRENFIPINTKELIGLALATSITEHLCRSNAFVILATHFQQLASVGYIYRNVGNYHFDVIYNENPTNNRLQRLHSSTILDQLKEQNSIVYSYTLRPGVCKDLHYGNWTIPEKIVRLERILGLALASQIEDLQTVVELAKCIAKYYIRKKEVVKPRNSLSLVPSFSF